MVCIQKRRPLSNKRPLTLLHKTSQDVVILNQHSTFFLMTRKSLLVYVRHLDIEIEDGRQNTLKFTFTVGPVAKVVLH